MKNKSTLLFALIFIVSFFAFCRTNPPEKVKIIEEHDPVVKNLEEKDSMRKVPPDTIHNNFNKKH
jgi:hypothetical protein